MKQEISLQMGPPFHYVLFRTQSVWTLNKALGGQENSETLSDDLKIVSLKVGELERYQILFKKIGAPWGWWKYPKSHASFDNSILAKENCCFVLAKNKEDIGLVQLSLNSASPSIKNLGVLSTFTGNGYGRLLLSKACQYLSNLGYSEVTLRTCSLDAPWALAFYKANGFSCVNKQIADAYIPASNLNMQMQKIVDGQGEILSLPDQLPL